METIERKLEHLETRFREAEERVQKLFHLSPTATSISDLEDGRLLDVNSAFCALFGYTREDLVGQTMLEMGLIVDRDARAAIGHRFRSDRRLRNYELQVRLRSGEMRNVLVSAEMMEIMGQARGLITMNDITERKRYEARIEYLASHDELTGLPNRALIRDRISQAIAHARRNGTQIAVMFLDLDRFKVINDGYGHPTGDALLKETARRLRALMREGDTVARLGGDEFLVLLPNLRRSADAYVVAQKILDSFERSIKLESNEAHMNTSVGVALFPQDGQDVDTLITNADVAMYRSKDLGGGIYQFFNADMSRETLRRVQLETHLRLALSQRELELRYQPKVDLVTQRITGCEALVSWNHPGLGHVAPAQFIPVAEESGLIVPIGDWVLHTACAQNKAWLDAGLDPITVAVNLSARQFLGQDVVEWVMDALATTGLPPSMLELELTESLIAEDPDKVAAAIRQLKSVGVRFSIDDFGTGYSSLSYLKRFPVDSLKIDQSFVKNVGAEPDDEAISLAVISLAHSLRLKVIAEGVESAAQLDFLHLHGCDEIQGFYFSKPLEAAEFAALLRSRHA
jgi:diguanylate cyclase (GGDEF)-like protein/PAS domain S-box-containing protein